MITREVLENYLDRSITIQDLLLGQGNFNDNLRMIKNIGAKFIGRAACQWGKESQLTQNLRKEKELAIRVHDLDREIVLQACIFETITPEVESISVPAWAFNALGLSEESRNFNYEAMLYPDGSFVDHWENGSVPDVSRNETKLWFYFLARSYIEAGFEAIHFGQVELMNKNDKDLVHYSQILTLIRAFAHNHARRHLVLCDSHVPGGGFVKDGKLLMDFHSFPLRIKEIKGKPQEAILENGLTDALYNRSKDGVTPNGWSCEHLPYLVEFDNWGASNHPGEASKEDLNSIWVWGYDEITWFAHQKKDYRHYWLKYAWNWIKKTDPNGHLQMPGGRGCAVNDPQDKIRWYYANNPGPSMSEGFGDEEVIRSIWNNDSKTLR